MRVTGPDWESTRTLQEMLADVESDKTLRWGQGGKDGLEQLDAFQTNGILCPTFTTDQGVAKDWVVRQGLEVWGRKLHHTQGSDIVDSGFTQTYASPDRTEMRMITTRKGNRVSRPRFIPGSPGGNQFSQRWLDRDFWVQKIDNVVAEYRQHIFNGKAIRRGRKILTNPELRGPLEIKSRRNGWHLEYGDFPAPPGLRDVARSAVASLGYLFGAVDIVETGDGRLWVLEVNSAPSLRDENTAAVYVNQIRQWVGQ